MILEREISHLTPTPPGPLPDFRSILTHALNLKKMVAINVL